MNLQLSGQKADALPLCQWVEHETSFITSWPFLMLWPTCCGLSIELLMSMLCFLGEKTLLFRTINVYLVHIKWISVFENVQNAQIQIILCMCKSIIQAFALHFLTSVVSNDSVSSCGRPWSPCADVDKSGPSCLHMPIDTGLHGTAHLILVSCKINYFSIKQGSR